MIQSIRFPEFFTEEKWREVKIAAIKHNQTVGEFVCTALVAQMKQQKENEEISDRAKALF